jgi:hypothetical protein
VRGFGRSIVGFQRGGCKRREDVEGEAVSGGANGGDSKGEEKLKREGGFKNSDICRWDSDS